MPLDLVALRYMTAFSCIGPDCEDTCCSGWAISVDEEHYRALEARMSASDAERAEFAATLQPDPKPDKHRYALMVLRPGDVCAMLDDDKLCRIHKRYGEDFLSNTCAIYPRWVARVQNRIELSGNVSCPEIARRCLLHEGSLDVVPVERARFVREKVFNDAGPQDDSYTASLDAVRRAVHGLLAAREFPTASRLFFIAFFAHQTAPFFKKGGAFTGAQLETHLAMLRRLPALEQLHAQFDAVEVGDPFAATVVTQVIEARQARATAVFQRLCDDVLSSYPNRSHESLWNEHRRRALSLAPELRARLDQYLERYCRNFFFQEWFTKADNFVDHVQTLLVRYAVVRFLLVSHPRLARDPDAAAVETIYSFTRTVEHETAVMAGILRGLREGGMQTLAHSMTLIKV